MKKKVYVSMIADLLHAGHVNILKEASKRGEVIVGLLTSTAINELNETSYLRYQQRLDVVNSLSMVSSVVPQESASYKENLLMIVIKKILIFYHFLAGVNQAKSQ